MKFAELLKFGEKFMTQYEATALLTHICKRTIQKDIEKDIPIRQVTKYKNLVNMRRSHVPLQHLLGYTYFHSFKFLVNSHCLIPRQDTEAVIDAFQAEFPDKKAPLNILEAGVGSGCISLTLLKLYRNAFGLGLEIMPETLEMAIKNQQKLRVKNGKMILFDIMQQNLSDLNIFQYDVLVSNPPYIQSDEIWKLQPEVRDFEPYVALNGGKDGLMYYHKLKEMKKTLNIKTLIVEIGFGQREGIERIFEAYTITAFKDLQGIDRALVIK